MTLRELLHSLGCLPPSGADPSVTELYWDSRAVQPGGLFLACRGEHVHGERFIPQALARGAVAVLVESEATTVTWREQRPCIPIPRLSRRLGALASHFHGNPGQKLRITGITGTNGKTTVAYLLTHAWSRRESTAMMGTLGNGPLERLRKTTFTTPLAPELQQQLAQFVATGVTRVNMEVSSHALDQGRAEGTPLECAVFTNLTHDHLDYHGTLERYAEAKSRLFTWPGLRHAVINLDDPFAAQLLARSPAKCLTYSLRQEATCRAVAINPTPTGVRLHLQSQWGEGVLSSQLYGEFNAANLLAALVALVAGGMAFETALMALAEVPPVPGRLEVLRFPGHPTVVIDYAHTPDGLAQALLALRAHFPKTPLTCVFGCGGNRDREKRPRMGAIAEQGADRVILTNDNPRDEDPAAIAAAIQSGAREGSQWPVLLDRREAIATALAQASPESVVLVAGKGHEETQEIAGQFHPFLDRAVITQCLGL